MDGNGRWAEQRGLPRTEGHAQGSKAVRKVVRAARRLGVRALTLFAFSEQNWGRPRTEVSTLMDLLRDYLVSERDEILSNGIQLRAIGELDRLPGFVRDVLCPLEVASADNHGMVLSLALSYGGREEIADAARELACAAVRGEIDPRDITAELLSARIPSVSVGDPDLLIRTGGELRVSNFLLWGAAYSELHFSPVLWPDFGASELYQAVAAYQARERRFGLTGQQARSTGAPSSNGSANGSTNGSNGSAGAVVQAPARVAPAGARVVAAATPAPLAAARVAGARR